MATTKNINAEKIQGNLSITSVSATTYNNLPTDIRVTGGTFNNVTDIITFTNNTGGTFTVTGITDYFVTGGTYSNGTATFTNNSGSTFTVSGFTTPFTGGTVSGSTNFTGGLSMSGKSVSTYGLIVATSMGYQNLF